MQEQEDTSGDPESVLGRVRDIRRKWAVQEDEALAYRLQDEEIAQHYNSNRTRNAIVREDAPRAREAQRQEELEALEERLQHLSVLQKQADEDGRLAKLLAKRDTEASKVKRHSGSSTSNGQLDGPLDDHSSKEMRVIAADVVISNLKRTKSPLVGSARLEDEPGPSRLCLKRQDEPPHSEDPGGEDVRKFQEERDAAIARALQEELDRYERDKQLALEAQDRELARMIHEKEKARLRRAKEKARLKAAEAASDSGDVPEGDGDVRTSSRNSSSSDRSRSVEVSPPKLPVKVKNSTVVGDPIGFRASPKPLPPHPPSQEVRNLNPPSQNRLEHHHLPVDPVPPYMPIHGYNRSSSKRK